MNVILHQHTSALKQCFSIRCLQFSSIVFNIETRHQFCTKASFKRPLLSIEKIPEYNKITGEEVKKSIPHLVEEVEEKFEKLEEKIKTKKEYSWKDVITNSELLFDKLGLAWSAVSHLHHVKNNPLLRNAFQEVQPQVVTLINRISQSRPMFDAMQFLESKSNTLDECQNRIINTTLRRSRQAGVHLEGEEKREFNNIMKSLAELSTTFMNNVLDSTKEFSHIVHQREDLEGLPQSLINLMASTASVQLDKNIDPDIGPWKLSLDMPCFEPFMKHSVNRPLREMLYLAYIRRASSGKQNNCDVIEKIRQLRKRKSAILGYHDYATLSLSNKMADQPENVWKMLNTLKEKSKSIASLELKTLQEFARNHGHEGELRHWDIAYWSERQREKLLSLNEEELRQYFPFPRVLEGLFALAEELFDVHIKEAPKGEVEIWHDDVKFFNIHDASGGQVASFFLDPYSRPEEKQGGAWMDSALDRNDALDRQPIAYLVCNQSPPIGETPSLMTFREVTTLFHEFGHGLQHMLTAVKYPSAAGINNIEWDAVELPSQFMENWLYDWVTMQKISSHYTTSESLPYKMFQQLRKGKVYHAGLSTLRQLYFSALDMELHTSEDDWRSIMKRVSDDFTVMSPHPEDHFPCSFLHIFSSSYAAGYYSYMWAEVLSADAFAAFEDVGLDDRDNISSLGKRFRDTVLALGGSKHPDDVFFQFRKRKATVVALLKSRGLQ